MNEFSSAPNSLSRAALAITKPSKFESSNFCNLVKIFPLMSSKSIEDISQGNAFRRNLFRFSFLLGDEVKIFIFFLFNEVGLKTKTSLKSALGMVAIISVPDSSSTGKSFQECTAMSAFPDKSVSLISEVNTPISGILCSGVVKSISPVVSLVKKFISISGKFSLIASATSKD